MTNQDIIQAVLDCKKDEDGHFTWDGVVDQLVIEGHVLPEDQVAFLSRLESMDCSEIEA